MARMGRKVWGCMIDTELRPLGTNFIDVVVNYENSLIHSQPQLVMS